jgi:D-alanyl-D-alanine carboxypeptidase
VRFPAIAAAVVAALCASAARSTAGAEALLLIDVDSGKVLHAENATYPWYPASVTKLMTLYLTLHALKDSRITPATLFTVSPTAMAQQPSKMGFPIGTQVTVDNAIKMLMVHSANDMAVLLAEGIDGSVENFADDMNRTAQHLGLTQTHYVNPNGLPAEGQVTSARDLAILARALIREFPDYESYWHIPAIKFGRRVMRNTNSLLGRYPGVDGMKTGFICASGFNLVASASRDGKRLVAVVLGAPSSAVRGVKAAQLFERGFHGNTLSWLAPSLGTVDGLAPVNAAPADLHEETCGKHRRRPAAEEVDEEEANNNNNSSGDSLGPRAFMLSNLNGPTVKPSELLGPPPAVVNPVIVFAGLPKKQPAAEQAALTPGAEAIPARARGRSSVVAPAQGADASADQGAAGAASVVMLPSSGAGATKRFAAAVRTGGAVPLPRPRPHHRPRLSAASATGAVSAPKQ